MSLIRIFVLCFVAGIAGGYAIWARPVPSPPAEVATPSAPVAEPSGHSAPLVATRESGRPPSSPTPIHRQPPAPLPAEGDYAKARELAADERVSATDVRTALEQVLAGKLPRELSPRDYDRLTNAVMRARAAERVLRGVDESSASAELRAEQQAILDDATSEAKRITGVELGTLKNIVDPGGGAPDTVPDAPSE